MSEAIKELVSSGALGATLVVVMAMLGWLVKVLMASFVRQTESVIKGMGELVEASRAIRDNCRNCRTDSLQTLRDAQTAIETHVEHVAWRVHDQAQGEQKELVGAAVEKIQTSLTGVAQSIREANKDMELSRPTHLTPAPVGGGVVQR